MTDDVVSPQPQAETRDGPGLRWLRLTQLGNARFNSGDIVGALSSYAQARELAVKAFWEWADAEDAVGAIVVSHLNLSEAQARLELHDEGASTLSRVHAGLLQMSGDAAIGAVMRSAARRHLLDTYAALLRYQAVYGARHELMRWLHRGCACLADAVGSEPLAPRVPPTLH